MTDPSGGRSGLPAEPSYRCVVIHNLKLDFFIGIFDFEREKRQPVVINLELFIAESGKAVSENIADYVSYADIVDRIKAIANSDRHVPLVENLSEQIADIALLDRRVSKVVIDVRKTEIIRECDGVGVIIERIQTG